MSGELILDLQQTRVKSQDHYMTYVTIEVCLITCYGNHARCCFRWGMRYVIYQVIFCTLNRPINVPDSLFCYHGIKRFATKTQERDEVNMNPFDFQIYKDVHNIAPKLPNEFDPMYILSLTAQYRREQIKNKRRKWLSALGSWIVAFGLRIKHGVHSYTSARHVSPRLVSIHHHRINHSK